MKRILLIFLTVMLSVSASFAFVDSYVVSRDKLPQEAQDMLQEYFPKVSLIKIDRHLLKKPTTMCVLPTAQPSNFPTKGSGSRLTAATGPCQKN